MLSEVFGFFYLLFILAGESKGELTSKSIWDSTSWFHVWPLILDGVMAIKMWKSLAFFRSISTSLDEVTCLKS